MEAARSETFVRDVDKCGMRDEICAWSNGVMEATAVRVKMKMKHTDVSRLASLP